MKIAKYLLLFCMLVVLGCGGNGDVMAQKNIKKFVAEFNKECPISLGKMGNLESVKFDGTNIVLYGFLNENYTDIDFIKQHEQECREVILSFLSNKSQDIEPFIKEMLKKNVGWNIVYTGEQTGKKTTIQITPKEIKSMLERPAPTPEELLEQEVTLYNQRLPHDMGNGLVITKLSVEGAYMVYTCEVDENQVSIDYLRENKKDLKSLMKMLFISELNNPAGDVLLDLCKESKKDIKYRYMGKTSGKTAEIDISVDEIISELDNPTDQNSPQKMLELLVSMANKNCPMVVEEGITTTRFFLDGKKLVIECEVDEDLYDINLIKKNQKEMKSGMIESLRNSIEAGSDPLITTCIENNTDMIYRYIGKTSGKKADIVISPDEL